MKYITKDRVLFIYRMTHLEDEKIRVEFYSKDNNIDGDHNIHVSDQFQLFSSICEYIIDHSWENESLYLEETAKYQKIQDIEIASQIPKHYKVLFTTSGFSFPDLQYDIFKLPTGECTINFYKFYPCGDEDNFYMIEETHASLKRAEKKIIKEGGQISIQTIGYKNYILGDLSCYTLCVEYCLSGISTYGQCNKSSYRYISVEDYVAMSYVQECYKRGLFTDPKAVLAHLKSLCFLHTNLKHPPTEISTLPVLFKINGEQIILNVYHENLLDIIEKRLQSLEPASPDNPIKVKSFMKEK